MQAQRMDTMEEMGGKQEAGCCLGSYTELTPREFDQRKSLLVVLYQHPHAVAEFSGFKRVVNVESCAELESRLKTDLCCEDLGLVCGDGEKSSRLAIRLSQKGQQVYHLSGGLAEWHRYFRPAANS